MQRYAGTIALVLASILAVTWFFVYLAPQNLGLEDTDSPADSLQFLRQHAEYYRIEALLLWGVAVALIVGVLAASDALAALGSLARRSTLVLGLIAATCFFLNGVVRASIGPLLYIDGLDAAWGEAAYLAVHLLSAQGFMQGALVALGLWIVSVGWLGWRRGALPWWLVVLAIAPAFRLVAAPLVWFGLAMDELWIVFIAAIPLTLLWPGLLGLGLARRSPAASPSVAPAAATTG